MAKYLLSYHGGGMPETDAEREQITAAWNDWLGSLGQSLVDLGNPVGRSSTIASDGAVSDGGGSNPVSGYSILEASDFDAALASAKGCPILQGGGSVEVGELFDVM
jgi:hypothetical protein